MWESQAFRDQQVPALEKDTSFMKADFDRQVDATVGTKRKKRSGDSGLCIFKYIYIFIYIYICVYASFSIHAPCLLSNDCLVEEMDLLWQRYAPNFGAGVSWEHFQKQLRENLRHLH